ncbi:olfactory receptor 10A7-like [Chrysemys picta bellii]|uniref:olfactory receptor 10A7-like n=1 Tax=Chrysemys picta bellii TaxID=8478 RepID=UPI0032B1E420
MANTDWGNQTSITEFILLGFGDLPELEIFLFLLFLLIYIVTVSGNILIIVLAITDRNLHTPMYFFLGNLSCLETCYTSTILPRVLASLLTGDKTISISDCAECYLLAVMSYDRFLAICKPLHYAVLMNGRFCLQLAAGAWINGFLAMTMVIVLLSQLIFCGPNEIDHFYCECTEILNLYCSDTNQIDLVITFLAAIFTLPPFVLTVASYVCIVITILRIPSTTGRQKAFSTCSSHLIVVTIFYGTIMILYMLPKTNTLRALNKVFSVFYTVLTPMANPFIYSLRNTEVKETIGKMVSKCLDFTRNQQSHVFFSFCIKRKW